MGMPLVLLPLYYGGVDIWYRSWIAGLFAVGGAVLLWLKDGVPVEGVVQNPRTKLLLGIVLAYPFLQVLPLPLSWIAAVSPERAEWIARAETITFLRNSWAGVSYISLDTLVGGIWWLFLAGFGLLLAGFVGEERNEEWLLRLLMVVAALEAVYGLLQVLIPSMGVLGEDSGAGVARGTFMNRDHFAAFLGMIWPVLLAHVLASRVKGARGESGPYAYEERRRQLGQKQVFLGFVTGLVLLSLIFSQSRGGILGALIASTVFVTFSRARQRGMVIFVVGCWLVAVAYGGLIGFDEILLRFERLGDDAGGRLQIWGYTLRLIADHPLTGTGLGTYGSTSFLYQFEDTDLNQIGDAHNDYLQLAADLGVPMALLMAFAAWGLWWWAAWRLRASGRTVAGEPANRSEEGRSLNGSNGSEGRGLERARLMAAGTLSGSAALLCHSWVEFNWQIPASQVMFVVLLVLLHQSAARLAPDPAGVPG
jgi:O-antigen ligase